jgi:hypothetical protein
LLRRRNTLDNFRADTVRSTTPIFIEMLGDNGGDYIGGIEAHAYAALCATSAIVILARSSRLLV